MRWTSLGVGYQPQRFDGDVVLRVHHEAIRLALPWLLLHTFDDIFTFEDFTKTTVSFCTAALTARAVIFNIRHCGYVKCRPSRAAYVNVDFHA